MDPITISLITSLISLLIKYEPQIAALGGEILLLYKTGGTLSPEELTKVQAYTDLLMDRLRVVEEARLSVEGE